MKALIISKASAGFTVVQVEDIGEVKEPIVAIYDNLTEANEGLKRAKGLEQTIRPFWLAALAHANKLEMLMLDLVWAAAKPLANEGEPG